MLPVYCPLRVRNTDRLTDTMFEKQQSQTDTLSLIMQTSAYMGDRLLIELYTNPTAVQNSVYLQKN